MSDDRYTEAVGVFHDAASLQAAADDLMTAGFDRAYLNLLAGEKAIEAKLGHAYEKVSDLEDNPDVATQAYSAGDSRTEALTLSVGGLFYVGAAAAAGAVVASGGTVAAIIIAALAGGGTGGLIGGALASFLGHQHANKLDKQLGKGGLLLWVRTVDEAHENRAIEILKAHGADDVHLHQLPPMAPSAGEAEIYGYLDWMTAEPHPTTPQA